MRYIGNLVKQRKIDHGQRITGNILLTIPEKKLIWYNGKNSSSKKIFTDFFNPEFLLFSCDNGKGA